MKVIALEQRSPEWQDWRRQGVTASDAAVLLGESLDKTAYQLWAEKRGVSEPPEISGNPNVRRGVLQEDDARLAMEAALGDSPLLPICAEFDGNPRLRASFDGVTSEGYPVELKCPCQKVYDEVKTQKAESEGYRRAFHQVQFHLLVSEAPLGWLCFFRRGQPLLPVKIVRDEAVIRRLREAAVVFWQQVQQGVAPGKDPGRDVYVPEAQSKDWAAWGILSTEYRLIQAELDQLEKRVEEGKSRQKQLQQSLCQLMADFHCGEGEGLRVRRSQYQGSVDYRQALEALCAEQGLALPDLEPFRRKGREQVKVTVLTTLAELMQPGAKTPPSPVASFYWH